jgi:hypothetical protein
MKEQTSEAGRHSRESNSRQKNYISEFDFFQDLGCDSGLNSKI